MVSIPLPTKWLELISDPYAILGTSVNADEQTIIQRYRTLAKSLHPDYLIKNKNPERELAAEIFTKLINPAYEQLKDKTRRYNKLAGLNLAARNIDQQLIDKQIMLSEEMKQASPKAAEFLYEQAITSYAQSQYKFFSESFQITYNLNLLNLFYLYLLQEPSLNKSEHQAEETTELTFKSPYTETPRSNGLPYYALRHYERANEYVKQKNWTLAVMELRCAIKLETNNSKYYALLGVVHLQQGFPGMAKVYIRQALKLDPQQPLAIEYAAKLNLGIKADPKSMAKAISIAALLSNFLSGKRS
jgi:curved DNA-binding protein CbpA